MSTEAQYLRVRIGQILDELHEASTFLIVGHTKLTLLTREISILDMTDVTAAQLHESLDSLEAIDAYLEALRDQLETKLRRL